MKLAIADPPYLGRSFWYGGRGGRGAGIYSKHHYPANNHPAAEIWDKPESHVALVHNLFSNYDGFAISAAANSLHVYLRTAPTLRVGVWNRTNAMPTGARVTTTWEPVLFHIPKGRRKGAGTKRVRDVLTCPKGNHGFAGSKPALWWRWVLEILGYDPATDSVDDLFPGTDIFRQVIASYEEM